MAARSELATVAAPQQPTRTDFRAEVTNKIIKMLETGVAPWQRPWRSGALQFPRNPTTNKLYRGGNALQLLIVMQERGHHDPRWVTYRQAETQGWQVRRGERGTGIEFWDAKRTDREEHEKVESKPVRMVHRVYTVFHASQIEGMPEYSPKSFSGPDVVAAGEKILSASGAKIEHDQREQAYYDKRRDEIHLPQRDNFYDAAGYYGTALHELAHWSGAPSRLNRASLQEFKRFGDPAYAAEELRAELASVFLAAERGIPHDASSHAAYVAHWIAALRSDKHELFRAAKEAHQATDFLLALERGLTPDQALAVAGVARSKSQTLKSGALSPDASQMATTQWAAMFESPNSRDGRYHGAIMGESNGTVLQQLPSGRIVGHARQSLSTLPTAGEQVLIQYQGGAATVSSIVRQLSRSLER